eukprot:1696806-Pleurochrysis_carterae.AAC.1
MEVLRYARRQFPMGQRGPGKISMRFELMASHPTSSLGLGVGFAVGTYTVFTSATPRRFGIYLAASERFPGT